VVGALRVIWQAAGYPWSARLRALLPMWLPWARRRLSLSAETEARLRTMSPRQMDRVLRADKAQLRKRLYGRTKPGTLLKHHIPLRTDRWDVTEPGWSEIDLVSHSGDCAEGEFVYTLDLTDIDSTWVESYALLGKSQVRVQAALAAIQGDLPFRLRGIDSDNGSEFINAHLLRYCRAEQIQFTRGRPYKKDDNAHIEQKNWTHVRKILGYVRYDTPEAVAAINDVYADLRLWIASWLAARATPQRSPRCAGSERRWIPLRSPRASSTNWIASTNSRTTERVRAYRCGPWTVPDLWTPRARPQGHWTPATSAGAHTAHRHHQPEISW
jgi:hypothetical protein